MLPRVFSSQRPNRCVRSSALLRCTAQQRMFSGVPPPPPTARNSTKGVFVRNMLLLGGAGFGIGWAISELMQPDSSAGEDEEKLQKLFNVELAEVQSLVTDRVFLDIELPAPHDPKERVVERVVVGLYGKECPQTTKNFLSICEGYEKQIHAQKTRKLSYENCVIHRVIPGFMMQSGDFTTGDGTGGECIFSTRTFPDESFRLKHTGLGVLSMANRGRDTNTSQFFICFKATPWLDNKHVVFGQVLSGASTLRRVESFGSKSGQVTQDLRIVKCGKLPPLEESAAMQVDTDEVLDEAGKDAKRIMK